MTKMTDFELVSVELKDGFPCLQCDARKKGCVTCCSDKLCGMCRDADYMTDSHHSYVFKRKKALQLSTERQL